MSAFWLVGCGAIQAATTKRKAGAFMPFYVGFVCWCIIPPPLLVGCGWLWHCSMFVTYCHGAGAPLHSHFIGGGGGIGEGIVWCKHPISEKEKFEKTKKSILSPFKGMKISRWYSCTIL